MTASQSTPILRTIVAASRTIRPLCIRSSITRPVAYHTHSDPIAFPYNTTETQILNACVPHIRNHGFTQQTLSLGARDAGYLPISTNLFPRGAFDLVVFWLVRSRLGLKGRVEENGLAQQWDEQRFGSGRRVRALVLERLRMNAEEGIVGKWTEALALMAQPSCVPASLAELHRLSDEIWYLAGDTAVDTSWYTKRASLSAVYSSTELYQTQDDSPGLVDTERFLDSRLKDAQSVGGTVGAVGQWLGYTGHSFLNVARSRGLPF